MPYLITPKNRKNKGEAEDFVCQKYAISREIFVNTVSRHQAALHARYAVWLVLRFIYHQPFELMGELYSKHHSTVMNGIRRGIVMKMDIDMGISLGKTGVKPVDSTRTTSLNSEPAKVIPLVIPIVNNGLVA